MTTTYCDFSDLPTESCAHCKGFATKVRTRSVNSFEAHFPGLCAECPDPIDEGDIIVKTVNGYAHDGCR